MSKTHQDWIDEYQDYLIILKLEDSYITYGQDALVIEEIIGQKTDQIEGIYKFNEETLDFITESLENAKISYLIAENDNVIKIEKILSNKRVLSQIEIIYALMAGMDPFTGEILEENHLILHPEIKKLLEFTKNTLTNKENKKKNIPTSNGVKWSEEEEKQLVQEFKSGMNIKEIAEIHKRTIGAILARLYMFFPLEIMEIKNK